ncbi:hypothetical protein BD626DRAFT_585116 [Schizophyllum amplum]|uniref:Uncharacterized protein n=1 Tax=Schizophyllum amplum TaxID=97359 RepID=A0A550C6D6_9AGAR|nr:hypothetical protein BD626DRAFT_585116 [Auriculariopsis ampla]
MARNDGQYWPMCHCQRYRADQTTSRPPLISLELFVKLGIDQSKGVLIFGPSTGRTLSQMCLRPSGSTSNQAITVVRESKGWQRSRQERRTVGGAWEAHRRAQEGHGRQGQKTAGLVVSRQCPADSAITVGRVWSQGWWRSGGVVKRQIWTTADAESAETLQHVHANLKSSWRRRYLKIRRARVDFWLNVSLLTSKPSSAPAILSCSLQRHLAAPHPIRGDDVHFNLPLVSQKYTGTSADADTAIRP